jgi:hypothetical protein
MEGIQVSEMTKTEKLRRLRADRKELRELQGFKREITYGGTFIQSITLPEIVCARLKVAEKLGFALLISPLPGRDEITWQIRAVKK